MKRNTRFQVISELRSRIVSLELPPGTSISENELATTLGVSRTPIREALLILAEEQLVEVFPRVGTFVTPVDVRLVKNSQFLREALELSSLDTLDLPLSEVDVERIEDNLHDQERIAEQDPDIFFKYDEEFHRLLMASAGHGRSWAFVSNAKAHLDRARMLGMKEASHPRKFYLQHVEIFEEIKAGNRGQARDLLQRHLRVVFDDIQTVAQAHPHLFIGWQDEKDGADPVWSDFLYLPPDARMKAFRAAQNKTS